MTLSLPQVSSINHEKVQLIWEIVHKKVNTKKRRRMEWWLVPDHEYQSMEKMWTELTKYQWNGVSISIAHILGGTQDLLTTKFVDGVNLEIWLLNGTIARGEIIQILRYIKCVFLEIWKIQADFAPRNIIFDTKRKVLYLVDFERGLFDIDTNKFNGDEIKFLCSFSIAEEISCLFTIWELEAILGNIFSCDLSNVREDILSFVPFSKKRINLMKEIFGKDFSCDGRLKIHLMFLINCLLVWFIQEIAPEWWVDGYEKIWSDDLAFKKIFLGYLTKILIPYRNKIGLKSGFEKWEHIFTDHNLHITYTSKNGKWFPRSWIELYKFIMIWKYRVRHDSYILDIGTGEIAFLANSLASIYTQANVHALEKNKDAHENAIQNNHSPNLQIMYGDIRDFEVEQKYDILVSNPPMMPIKNHWSDHDSWWDDGLDIIYAIFEKIHSKLWKKGTILYINIFDFLWVENTLWRKRSFKSLLHKFNWKIVRHEKIKRTVKKWWETYKNYDHIRSLAPEFEFMVESNGEFFHEMHLMEILF